MNRWASLGRRFMARRVGIHTGSVIAGGAEKRIDISERTYSRAKDKVEHEMYFVNG